MRNMTGLGHDLIVFLSRHFNDRRTQLLPKGVEKCRCSWIGLRRWSQKDDFIFEEIGPSMSYPGFLRSCQRMAANESARTGRCGVHTLDNFPLAASHITDDDMG